MLDDKLQPWILEVNLSPSLVCDTPLDFHIKGNLLIDSLNLVGIKKFKRSKEVFGKKLKPQTKTAAQQYKNMNKNSNIKKGSQ